jgi:hypothetical protein
MLFILCIDDDYIKTLKTPTCFNACGIVIMESAHQVILYETLTNQFIIANSWYFAHDVEEFGSKL